jgi:hypothetical protein
MMRRYWHSETFLLMNLPIAEMYVLEPLDQTPVLAIGSAAIALVNDAPRSCLVEVGFGDYGAAYNVRQYDPRQPAVQDNGSDEIGLGWAPWGALDTFTVKKVNVTEFGLSSKSGYLIEPVVGEASFWATSSAPESVGIFELATQSARLLKDKRNAEEPTPVPGGVLAFDTGTSPFAIIHAKDDGTFTRVVTPTSPQVLSSKAVDRSNGNALVWVESDNTVPYTNSTLWTAPFATSESSLVRRKVAKLVDSTFSAGLGGIANDGVFLSVSRRNEATITRLSDGAQWKVSGEPGERIVYPIWVNNDEAILEIAPDPTGQPPNEPAYGLLRIARSTLGPPTFPPGL